MTSNYTCYGCAIEFSAPTGYHECVICNSPDIYEYRESERDHDGSEALESLVTIAAAIGLRASYDHVWREYHLHQPSGDSEEHIASYSNRTELREHILRATRALHRRHDEWQRRARQLEVSLRELSEMCE